MQVTGKGQITTPQAIRERWGLLPHPEVHFVGEGGRVFLEKDCGQISRGQDGVQRLQRLQQARPAGDPGSVPALNLERSLGCIRLGGTRS